MCFLFVHRPYLLLPLRQWGAGNVYCLPLSVVQLKGKHWRNPHCLNGVVETFGPYTVSYIKVPPVEQFSKNLLLPKIMSMVYEK